MPLTKKGETILRALEGEYGAEKGKEVLYAGKNSGRFTGIDARVDALCDAVDAICDRAGFLVGKGHTDPLLEDLKQELHEAQGRGDHEAVIRLREKIAMHAAGE